jgi:hypothetical protein
MKHSFLLYFSFLATAAFWWAVGLFMGENTDISDHRVMQALHTCTSRGGVAAIKVLGYRCHDDSIYRWPP